MSPWERLLTQMSLSGGFTVTDVWILIKWLYFLPGDLLIWALMQFQWATFWNVTAASYGGWGSGILSFVVWGSAWYAIGAARKVTR